jgi:hypothetical protein
MNRIGYPRQRQKERKKETKAEWQFLVSIGMEKICTIIRLNIKSLNKDEGGETNYMVVTALNEP